MKFKNRHSIRLNGFDYGQNGHYFVTICCQNRGNLFGEIVEGKMTLNKIGEMVLKIWQEMPQYCSGTEIDEFVIMPDHIHGILIIKCRGVIYHAQNKMGNENIKGLINQTPTLGQIIRYFKAKCTYEINKINQTKGLKIFQRNYFERIIRDENEYLKVKEYIKLNPVK